MSKLPNFPMLPDNPSNSDMRQYAHDIVDYFADVAEAGEVCGAIENRCLIIFVKDNRIMFGIGEK